MRTIARVIESMLTRDATQQLTQLTGQTFAVASRGVWGWGGGFAYETSSVI
jgi:hypothetical protein